jgi:serine phosphatase RsbU (regulator of sigma subunit)
VSERTRQWIVRLYSLGLGIAGLIALAWASRSAGWPEQLLPLAYFLLLSFLVKHFGFRAAPDVTHSLGGVVDVAALLTMGTVAGGWVAALSSLLYSEYRVRQQRLATPRTILEVPLFNGGLKAIMALAGGAIYQALGGTFAPAAFTWGLVMPLLVLCLTWAALDHLGWAIMEYLQSGRSGLVTWLRTVFTASVLVELLPLPVAMVIALVHTLGLGSFALLALAVLSVSIIVRLLVEARQKLEARIAELTTLNAVGQAILEASLNKDELCELVYKYASRIVDTRNFLLGLIDEASKQFVLEVWTRDGVRQPKTTVAVGGVAAWMQETKSPVLIHDLEREKLPFTPIPLSSEPSHSALFVPLLAEAKCIGYLSIRSHTPHAFTEDHQRILAAIANQVAVALENTRLYQQAAEKQHLEQELKVARDIQKSLLPSFCPFVPGFELAADWRSASEVSGDFYDFVTLAGGKLGLLIADVSDKGVPAALFMALSRSLVRSGVIGASGPSEGLRRANTWIIKDSQSDMFVTLFYGVLDPAARTLIYANAGHNPPLLYRAASGTIESLAAKGIVLGVLPEIELEERQVTMVPGDLLVLYTDGVTEAINEHEEAFGEERLIQAVRQHHDLEAREVIAQIRAAVLAFTGDRPRFDDATLVVLKCRGAQT